VKVSKADDEIVRLWDSNERRKRASAADIGIAYHRIMEFIDFSRVCDEDGIIDEAYIAERAEFLRDRGAIEEDVYRSLDLSKAADFFAKDIGQRAVRAAKAGTLRKEKPFTLKTARGGREMLVQGVIDCCFEEDGKMILIDYKSNYMDPRRPREEELARLRNEYGIQIELYSEAIRKGSGKEVAEAYLWLFAADEALAMM
jgi:ATP-dependent helicase/nuclease subunit A